MSTWLRHPVRSVLDWIGGLVVDHVFAHEKELRRIARRNELVAAANPPTTLTKVAAATLCVLAGGLVVGFWVAIGLDVHYLIEFALGGWLLWLSLDRATVHSKADTATDDADRAVRRTTALEHQLNATEPPGSGRHATSASPAPHPEGHPS